jgi:Putative prokaryotic signal transducing protein
MSDLPASNPPPDAVPAPAAALPVSPMARQVLDYAAPVAAGMTIVARCKDIGEAEVRAGVLEAEGIPYQVCNQNVVLNLGPYAGAGADVEVHVRREDAERAAAVLARYADDADLEPIEDPPDAPPPVDDEGRAIDLVVAAAYDTARRMRDASTVLAAARVRFYVPTLALRGDRPPGEGARFVVRVAEEDLERARSVLEEAAAESDDEEDPRCPRCSAWRVHPVRSGGLLRGIGRALGLGKPLPFEGEGFECLACRHQGPREEFVRSDRSSS